MAREVFHNRIALSTLAFAVATMPYSIRFCHLGFVLFVINWIWEGGWEEKAKWVRENYLVAVFPVFVLLHLGGMLYTENTANGWFNIEKKIFLFLLPIPLATSFRITAKEKETLYLVFIASCLIAAWYCIGYAIVAATTNAVPQNFGLEALANLRTVNPGYSENWMHFSYVSLGAGLQLHPTYFAFYLFCCLLMLIELYLSGYFEHTPIKARFAFVIAAFICLFIFLLNARIVILLTIVLMGWAVLFSITHRFSVLVSGSAILVCVLCGVLFFFNPISRFRNLQESSFRDFTTPGEVARTSIAIRTSLLWLSGKAIQQTNPVLGNGTGDANDLIQQLSEQFRKRNILNTYDPHNQYIQTYLALGFPGLLTLIISLAYPLYQSIKSKAFLASAMIFSFGVVCCTESALEMQKGIAFIALFLPLIFFRVSTTKSMNFKLSYA